MDQVQNFVLGGIISDVIYSDSIGLLQFFPVLILWTLLVLSLKFIKNHNRWVKSVIDGKSVWIIVNGKVQAEECMKNGISAHDLMFKLRAAGIYEISSVKRAVMEQNGQFTVSQYGDPDILEIIKRDEEWLQQELDRLHLEASQVYIGEYIDGKLVAHRYPS